MEAHVVASVRMATGESHWGAAGVSIKALPHIVQFITFTSWETFWSSG